jgi:hypothetical protein
MPVQQTVRTVWTRKMASSLYEMPFNDLLYQAQSMPAKRPSWDCRPGTDIRTGPKLHSRAARISLAK